MEKLSDHLYIPPMGRVLEEAAAERAAKSKGKSHHKRFYSGANINRLNKDWTTTPYSQNYSLRRDLRILRARSRDMCANVAHFKKFLGMCRSNIIGPKAIQLQVNARLGKRAHTNLNSRVELAWWEWCFAENCSASGKLDWTGQQNLFVNQLIRDGEALLQFIEAGPFGLQLKFWNVDYLDETYNDTLPDGRRVIMSVEIDANGRPTAYWLTTPSSDINFTQRQYRERIRVPADQMIHAFIVNDEETQVRGVPWAAAGLLAGKNLHVYTGSVIDQAKMTAMSGGFITKKTPDESELIGEEDEDGVEHDIQIDFSPASFHELPDNYEFQQFDPKQPTQNHAEFVRTILHEVAASLGINYFSLAGDMGNVNYSSGKIGLHEERDLWRTLQKFVANALCRAVYHRWLRAAMLNGKLELSAKDYQNVQNPKWCPRGWGLIEPLKEVNANVIALQNNLATYTDIFADQGIDLVEWLETKQAEERLFEEYGIEYGPVAPKAEAKPNKEGEEETDEEPKKPQDDGERGYTNGTYVS